MGKTYRRDSDKFDRNKQKNNPGRPSVIPDLHDMEEDQEYTYERIRFKTRPTVPKQTEKDS